MRISIVTETWAPEINGVALTVQGLARGLRELNHSIEIIRPARDIDHDLNHQDGFDELLVTGARVPRYPGLHFGLPAASRLQQHWKRFGPDAIYIATEGPLGHSALSVSRKLGIPAATGFHTRFDDYLRHYQLGWLSPWVFASLRRFHNRGMATLVPTRELATFLQSRGFTQVRLLQRAVDTQLFNPQRRCEALRKHWGLDDNGLAVIYVGRLAAEKNLNLAVRTFNEIRRTHAHARFIMVGDGPLRTSLEAISRDVIFTGIQRGEDLARCYASGDLFLFPSTTETFGNVTLEAMASGVATVAFDYGAVREHMLDGLSGRAIALHDDDAFIDAALTLAAHREHRMQIGKLARCAVEHLDPSSVSACFAELLSDLQRRSAA